MSASVTQHPRITPEAVCRVLEGNLLGRTMAKFGPAATAAVAKVIAEGINTGATNDELVRKMRGSRAELYADAILPITTKAAQSIVRTAVAGAMNAIVRPVAISEVAGAEILDGSFARFRNSQRTLGLVVRNGR